MQMLSVQNVSKRYGEKLLFEDLSFVINEGEKVALLAANGTGKSSLIRAIIGLEAPDSGDIRFANSIRYGYLMQEPKLEDKATVLENVLFANNPATKAILRYEKALSNPEETKELNLAIADMDATQAWDYETRVKQMLFQLNIRQFHQVCASLSGGEKKRVALAKVLINEPDFLILDEPTNHLDLDMIEWLENWLVEQKITLFLITHDRYFLENVCSRIIELENGQLYSYSGNYADYLIKKEARRENEIATISKAKNLMRTELEWMRRMPKARGTKSKARIDAFYDLKKVAHQKIEEKDIEFQINPERLGSKIVELHNVGMSFGEKTLFQKVDYKFKRFDKIGIIGPNGAGKSTFLKILTQEQLPQTGKVVIGETVKFGIYSQDGIPMKEGMRVIEFVREFGEYIPLKGGSKITAAQLLERFMFPGFMHYVHISKLSGGERRRLYLLSVLIQNPNFLILDEPTNDLDIMTLQILEEFLVDFPGCILIVSHDRFFMDKLVDHVFVFHPDGYIEDFPGNYTQFRNERPPIQQKWEIEEKLVQKETKTESEKLSYEERKVFNRLTKEIEKLEAKKKEIHDKMIDLVNDYEQLNVLQAELKDVEELIDEKSMLWLEMSEKV